MRSVRKYCYHVEEWATIERSCYTHTSNGQRKKATEDNKSKQLQVAFSLYTSIKMVTGDRQILALQLSFIYI